MTRTEQLLRHIDRGGLGIEIGPSHNPVAPKREGFRVHIIDHLTRDGLIRKYTKHGVSLDRIEEVDFVWRGEPYAALTQRPKQYDWVIASHVIEHTPDLVAFLNSCDGVLKDDGVLSLAVPDKRYCFDRFRPVSGLAGVIDRHIAGTTSPTAGACAEYYLYVTRNAERIAWDPASETADFGLVHTTEDAVAALRAPPEQLARRDIHHWVFTPSSFRLLVQDLHTLGLSPFLEVDFAGTDGYEFFVTLGRKGRGTGQSRLALLRSIEHEARIEGAPRWPRWRRRIARLLS
jgi:SAM-dependent methyltransferase